MRLPWWGHAAIWLLFATCVYLPLGYLGAEAIAFTEIPAFGSGSQVPFSGIRWDLFGRSVLLAVGATALAVVLGVPYAFLCAKTDLPGQGPFSVLFLTPLLIPPYIHAIVWSRLLSPVGPVNQFLTAQVGITPPPLDAHNLAGAVFVLAMAYFPFVTLLTLSGLKSLDRGYEEAAVLQNSGRRAMWKVTLPMIRPHVIAGSLFVFVFSMIDFGVPDLLRVQVYPIEIFISFSAFYDERAAVLSSLPLLALTSVLIALQVWTMRERSYVSLGAGQGLPFRYRLGAWRPVGFFFCCVVIAISVAVPLVSLVAASGPWGTYTKVLRSSAAQIGDTLVLAAVAAMIMAIFSLFVAISIRTSRGTWRTLMEYLSQLPFAVPSIVLGIGLIMLWNRPQTEWVYGTHWIIVLGYVAHFIPFTIRVLHANMQQVNPRLFEAASLSAAGNARTYFRIALPLLRTGLLTAFFIAFILSFGELGITLLVTPPGTETIPVKVYNFMHYGAEATVATLCLVLIAIQALVAAVVFAAGRSFSRARP